VESGWEYCPKCGSRLERGLSDIFSRVEKEAEEMSKAFEKNFEVFNLPSGPRQKPVSRGFSIKIVQGSGQKPKVSVNTFGDVDRKGLENEIRKLGVIKAPLADARISKPLHQEAAGLSRPTPSSTEEPKTSIRCVGNRVIVEMRLPGVAPDDIEVVSLQSSIEVKAVAGDKAYFKILTRPERSHILKKEFSGGILRLEIGS
jgi:HSP20 family molecular chaperone IbpA